MYIYIYIVGFRIRFLHPRAAGVPSASAWQAAHTNNNNNNNDNDDNDNYDDHNNRDNNNHSHNDNNSDTKHVIIINDTNNKHCFWQRTNYGSCVM